MILAAIHARGWGNGNETGWAEVGWLFDLPPCTCCDAFPAALWMASSAVLVEHSTPPPSPHTTLAPKNATSCILPYIDPSAGVVSGGESATLTSNFLPPDLVLALQRQGSMRSPPRGAKMPPPGRSFSKPASVREECM